jgi:uncharacterized protein (DUF849 family)
VQACLNGSRAPQEHPALPVTPQELAKDAQRVVAAGARALHVHPRNAQGAQSLDAQDIADALLAIRAICPGVPIGVSTALWIEPNVERRLERIRTWVVRPDYASVNFSEPGVADLCAHFLSCGVGIEAGIWSVEDADLLLQLGLAERCLRILIEAQERAPDAAVVAAKAMLERLAAGHVRSPRRLLHGDTESVVWPTLELALQRGLDARIGLEDTLTLPDGRQAADNAELVAAVFSKARQIGVIKRTG